MRVCIDTNVLLRLFGTNSPLAPLKLAVVTGQIEIVVSNDILLEYEEVVGRLSGQPRWQQIEGLLVKLSAVFGNVLRFDPQYHFHLIAVDPDDNKFADCAIAAEADFIVTSDGHFAALRNSGYKPQPITPEDFIARFLTADASADPEEPRTKKRPPQ